MRPFLSAGVPVCVCVCVCVDWFSARSTWPAFRWRSPTIGCATAIRGRRAGPSSCCPSTFTAASKTRPTARNGSTLRFDPPRQSPPMPSPSAVALVPLSRFFFFLFFSLLSCALFVTAQRESDGAGFRRELAPLQNGAAVVAIARFFFALRLFARFQPHPSLLCSFRPSSSPRACRFFQVSDWFLVSE